jgi:P-type Cu+ transporter
VPQITTTGEVKMESIDPVCGMSVEIKPDALRHDYKGKTYYFCNPHCLESFKKNPEKFLKG